MSNIFNDLGTTNPDSVLRIEAAEWAEVSQQQHSLSQSFTINKNEISDPGVKVFEQYYSLLPAGNVYDNIAPVPGPWFDVTSFKGAFYTYLWISDWTLLHQSGLVP